MNIKTFEETTNEDITLVGGKGMSLGVISQAELPVPPGFIVTTEVYKNFFDKPIPNDVTNEILQAFKVLKTKRVAVRSSAVAEDSTTASWAGQLETYLNITEDNLIENIKKCWDSIHSQRARIYAQKQGLVESQQVAVVVQKMIDSEVSGVMFTVNPVTKNEDEIMLEAIYGLGELLVQGIVTPDSFIIDRRTLEIKSDTKGEQDVMLAYRDGQNKEIPLSSVFIDKKILESRNIKELAKLGLRTEGIFKTPIDIEWAIEKGEIFIVQARPITTLSKL